MLRQDECAGHLREFKGACRWLSNFWPIDVEMNGDIYPTVEHAYQAAKSLDPWYRRAVRLSKSPGAAKKIGRSAALRPDWEEVKLEIMKSLLNQKFKNCILAALLRATGDAILEEGNTWGDEFWGIYKGKGANHLGRLLMQIRTELQSYSVRSGDAHYG